MEDKIRTIIQKMESGRLSPALMMENECALLMNFRTCLNAKEVRIIAFTLAEYGTLMSIPYLAEMLGRYSKAEERAIFREAISEITARCKIDHPLLNISIS